MKNKLINKDEIEKYIEENYYDEINLSSRIIIDKCVCLNACQGINLEVNELTFQEYLFKKIDEKDIKDSMLYKSILLTKQTFSKIRSDKFYHPDKDTAVKFCIGLKLNMDETEELLEKAGYILSYSIKRDLVFRYFFENEIYDIQAINEILYELDMKLLM